MRGLRFLSVVRTHIASGNVVLASALDETTIKHMLEERLAAHVGRHIAVLVRDAAEMAAVLGGQPLPGGKNPSQTVAFFLDEAPAADTIEKASGRTDERIALGRREIYVDYPSRPGTLETLARRIEAWHGAQHEHCRQDGAAGGGA